MTTRRCYILLFSTILFLIINFIALQLIHVDAVKFATVPFDNIPIAKISTDNREYRLGADFSIDFGDEAVIQKNFDAKSVQNMTLDKKVNGSSLELACDSNDECGTSLAPVLTKIYLVNTDAEDDEIVKNSVPNVELENNECGTLSIQECADFNFTIPNDPQFQNYKIVIDMSFDEAKWIFINPIRILN